MDLWVGGWGGVSIVRNALYDASGRCTRRRGPARREHTARQGVSYTLSGRVVSHTICEHLHMQACR